MSHALDMVQEFCQRALLLSGGHLLADGTPTEVVQRYSELMSVTAEMTV